MHQGGIKKPRKSKWIPKNLKKGALHADLGIPQNQKIPLGKLKSASRSEGVIGKRARLALTFRSFKTK